MSMREEAEAVGLALAGAGSRRSGPSRASRPSAGGRRRRDAVGAAPLRPDPSLPPRGRDPDYWHFALYFEQQAAKDKISLRLGAPLICDEIQRAMEAVDLKGGSGEYESGQSYADVYRLNRKTWQDCAIGVIDEFWTYIWNEDAVRCFCDLKRLDELMWAVCRKWEFTRYKRPPRVENPEPMKWL